jgi:uncharacterized SAM-dependent methyltransferase
VDSSKEPVVEYAFNDPEGVKCFFNLKELKKYNPVLSRVLAEFLKKTKKIF